MRNVNVNVKLFVLFSLLTSTFALGSSHELSSRVDQQFNSLQEVNSKELLDFVASNTEELSACLEVGASVVANTAELYVAVETLNMPLLLNIARKANVAAAALFAAKSEANAIVEQLNFVPTKLQYQLLFGKCYRDFLREQNII